MARLTVVVTGILLSAASVASAQEQIRKEAPPEIRALFGALTEGANGDAAAWEKFAQAHYTAELLKKETAAQRATLHQQIGDRFGTIGISQIRRQNDGPLEVQVKGSKAEGVLIVDLDFSTFKIYSISVQ